MEINRDQIIEAMANGDIEAVKAIRDEIKNRWKGIILMTERNPDGTITLFTYPWMTKNPHERPQPLTISREEYNNLMQTYDFTDWDLTSMVYRTKDDLEEWIIEWDWESLLLEKSRKY